MQTHASSWSESSTGLVRALVCNGTADFNRDGIIERHEYIGLRDPFNLSFHQNERINLIVFVAAQTGYTTEHSLDFSVIDPKGETIHSRSVRFTPAESCIEYVVPDDRKMPGNYSLKFTAKNGISGRKFNYAFSPVFSIK